MKKLLTLVTTGLLFSMGVVAHAEIVSVDEVYASCPKSIELNAESIKENIAYYIKEKNVEAAAVLASNCASFGSGQDVHIISPVNEALDAQIKSAVQIKKKQISYNKSLTEKQKAEKTAELESVLTDLNAKAGLCQTRYVGPESGSMDRAFAAQCELKVYRAFDSLYGPRDVE